MYVNNLPDVLQKSNSQWAEVLRCTQTQLLISFRITEDKKINAVSDMNTDLLHVCKWCFNKYLLLNLDKTKAMILASYVTLHVCAQVYM